MVEKDWKATLQALHMDIVNKAVKCHERNLVLDGRPPPISNSEKDITRKERSTKIRILWRLGSYKSRIRKDASHNVCADCRMTPHNVTHFFVCPAYPTTMTPSDLLS